MLRFLTQSPQIQAAPPSAGGSAAASAGEGIGFDIAGSIITEPVFGGMGYSGLGVFAARWRISDQHVT